ncbi:MAG: four helix bundle protein [Bacteroidetes bacterium]|nr:four helix bundle protein [Bacteroidota bacterium]MCL6097724.1 four helix bundle protein [Bacteroidota bacterium]
MSSSTQLETTKARSEFRKRIYFFTLKLIEFIDSLPKDNVTQRISDELFGSGTSVISNYIEATAASTKKDLANHTISSLKFANESKLWLALLRDSKRARAEKVKWFLDELDDISTSLANSINQPK